MPILAAAVLNLRRKAGLYSELPLFQPSDSVD